MRSPAVTRSCQAGRSMTANGETGRTRKGGHGGAVSANERQTMSSPVRVTSVPRTSRPRRLLGGVALAVVFGVGCAGGADGTSGTAGSTATGTGGGTGGATGVAGTGQLGGSHAG